MALLKEVGAGRRFIGRLAKGDDLLEALGSLCADKNVRLGRVHALGAVQRARLGYYDQGTFQYHFFEIPKPMEILQLVGNVSLREGAPVVHAHVTLSDEHGHAFGGHLAPGTIAFACEFMIDEMTGAELSRGFDEPTGLPLWPME